MLLSYNWLKEYLNIEDSVEKLADKITRGGLEVEEIIYLDKELSGLVVGYVKYIEKHPDAEKLNVCKIDLGDEELQIVCGASNIEKGQYVIVAKVGAKLPEFKIKKAKLRGVESYGMICSLKELGLSQSVIPKKYSDGIYVFDEEVVLGEDVVKVLGLNDTIIDIAVTPNRADSLSMRGLVYEIASLYNKKVNFKENFEKVNYINSDITVEKQSDNCNNYYAQVINNIEIKDSPLWLQNKLIKSGIRPINNIVDITNYVILEYGQPMHAFDKKLLGNNIIVRQAKDKEKLTTLDGDERTLTENDLVIANKNNAVALAGVMGGKETEVNKETKNIVLESAYFNPLSVRKTSSYHNLRSDSSARFEKGIDINLQKMALARAVELIKELCPEAEVEKVVGFGEEVASKTIKISTEYLNNIIGLNLTTNEIVNILNSLSFEVKVSEDNLEVVIPTRRFDITLKQDIAEEVARMYGYDNIPSTLPKFSKSTKGGLTYKQKMIRSLRKTYLSNGFFDTINYSLLSEEEAKNFSIKQDPKVKLLMPMSENHSTLRQSLIPGLLNTAKYNNARKQKNLKLLELGNVFFGSGLAEVQPKEEFYFSALITGKDKLTKWLKEEHTFDFYDIKGYLELTFKNLGMLEDISYKKAELENMHPGRTAKVFYREEEIGFLGEVHPLHCEKFDLEKVYVFEINLNKILNNNKVKPRYEEISKYPKVTRDIAMLINKDEEYTNIFNLINNLNIKLISNIELFDLYEKLEFEKEKKSIAITITYVDKEKTLTDEEINNAHNKVLEALTNYGALIR